MPLRRFTSRTAVAALSAAGLLVAACSSAPTPTRARVQAALITSGLPRAQAACATKQLFRVLTTSQLRNLAEHGTGALQTETSTALTNAIGTCTPATSAPPTTAAPGTTGQPSAPATSKP